MEAPMVEALAGTLAGSWGFLPKENALRSFWPNEGLV